MTPVERRGWLQLEGFSRLLADPLVDDMLDSDKPLVYNVAAVSSGSVVEVTLVQRLCW
jgi:hypothetical protein